MLSKNWCLALAVLASAAWGVSGVFAAGRGGIGPGARGGPAGCRTGSGDCRNSGRPLRTENDIFGRTWAYGNGFWGYGGPIYDWGYGYGYPGWGYSPWGVGYGWELEGVPYFSQFPPVYYGLTDDVPVVKAQIRSSWVGTASSQPGQGPAASASPSPPPLRIINPYYVEAKDEKR